MVRICFGSRDYSSFRYFGLRSVIYNFSRYFASDAEIGTIDGLLNSGEGGGIVKKSRSGVVDVFQRIITQ